MIKETLINEMLKAITCTESFNPENYAHDAEGEGWGYEIQQLVTDWVNENDVHDVECTVDLDGLNSIGYNEDFEQIVKFKYNTVEGYSEIMELADSVLCDENTEGVGFDGFARSDDRWNNEYFFTGSDCTFYILFKKIS